MPKKTASKVPENSQNRDTESCSQGIRTNQIQYFYEKRQNFANQKIHEIFKAH